MPILGQKPTDTITVKDVPAEIFIKTLAEQFKREQKIQLPENASIMKTGSFKEVSPQNPDWFYIRTATIARKLYTKPQLGVNTFKDIFGGKQRNGQGRNHHASGAGKLIRFSLQQLEKIGFAMKFNDARNRKALPGIEKFENVPCPRIITPTGQREMNQVAKKIFEQINGADKN